MQILAFEEYKMRKIFKNKKGLSTVITTLIILVVSILLATVVTYYAINVTSTRVEEESLYISKQHAWVKLGDSQAAFIIINTGGRDVIIDKITVRGQECDWSTVYYATTTETVTNDLTYQTSLNGTTISISTSTNVTLTQASTDLTLKSGYTMIVYIDDPDSLSLSDVGTTVGINVFTAQAQYYKECNVEAAS